MKVTQEQLLSILKNRFEENMQRHKKLNWLLIEKKLLKNPKKIWSLDQMEKTGGEPDVVGYDDKKDEYIFFDCSKESPIGRTNIAYDAEGEKIALKSKRKVRCAGNAIDMAAAMGIEILTGDQYLKILQKIGRFDENSASWVMTPKEMRAKGIGCLGCRMGAGDRGNYSGISTLYMASYYSKDFGFRGCLKI